METLDQIYQIVQYLPNDLAMKVTFGKLNQNDMAHVLHQLSIEWGFEK